MSVVVVVVASLLTLRGTCMSLCRVSLKNIPRVLSRTMGIPIEWTRRLRTSFQNRSPWCLLFGRGVCVCVCVERGKAEVTHTITDVVRDHRHRLILRLVGVVDGNSKKNTHRTQRDTRARTHRRNPRAGRYSNSRICTKQVKLALALG